MYWKKLCQHCSKNNYLGILTLIKQRLKRFASFSADGNNCSPLNEREGGGGGVLLYINIDHLSLQLSARQLIRLLGFSTICCLVLLTGEAKFNLGRLSHPSHHLSSSSTQKSLSPHRNGWAWKYFLVFIRDKIIQMLKLNHRYEPCDNNRGPHWSLQIQIFKQI